MHRNGRGTGARKTEIGDCIKMTSKEREKNDK